MPQDFAKILDDVCFTLSSIFKSTEIFTLNDHSSYLKQDKTESNLQE